MCDNGEHGGVPHVIVGSVAFHTKVNTLTPSSLFSFLHPPSDIPFVKPSQRVRYNVEEATISVCYEKHVRRLVDR
jgi:hypothetical protein